MKRYTPLVEKASCDEAFLDVTRQVNLKYSFYKEEDYNDETWFNSLFMGCEKGKGFFKPESDLDKKLYIAAEIAYLMRLDIDKELGYKASAGISHNKTVAKLSSS